MCELDPESIPSHGPSGRSDVRARKNPLGALLPARRSGAGTALILLAFIVSRAHILGLPELACGRDMSVPSRWNGSMTAIGILVVWLLHN